MAAGRAAPLPRLGGGMASPGTPDQPLRVAISGWPEVVRSVGLDFEWFAAAAAVSAMRAGASDFLVKPIASERLLAALEVAILALLVWPLVRLLFAPAFIGRLGGSPELDITYVRGAAFETLPCPETNFSLFTSVARPELLSAQAQSESPKSWIVTLAPNQNISAVLRDICQELGLTRALIRGGVGSLVGAILEPEIVVEPFVTEVLIEEGRIDLSLPAEQQVQLDVIIIDYQHGVHRGRLKPEVNSVLVTFELVLEAA